MLWLGSLTMAWGRRGGASVGKFYLGLGKGRRCFGAGVVLGVCAGEVGRGCGSF